MLTNETILLIDGLAEELGVEIPHDESAERVLCEAKIEVARTWPRRPSPEGAAFSARLTRAIVAVRADLKEV